MRAKEVWVQNSNERLGIRIEGFDKERRMWHFQYVDIVDKKPIYSFIYGESEYSKIKKLYRKFKKEIY